ncbi:hypothetical protein H2O64_17425 [Kordia sp. YSTF-M3]|uniref:DUF4468 domain-containing protein n=1 Tax=Kordia aestuariivivens TaxID=2759037 RepID=A0ABR7QD25_9FLAO|nr:hypothetical protein [Kordia aestuariivivens]MBC8756459.1 hypothetical protein [Kordia aestuariivivens]
MKIKTFVSILIFVFSQYAFSQEFYSDIDEKSSYNVTISFKNNEQKQYNNVRLSKIYTGMKQNNSVLPSFKPLSIKKLKKQKIVVKQKKKQKIEIPKDSISELIIEDVKKNITYKFKNSTIKGFDKELNLVTVAENILLPLQYTDSINIYGYKVTTFDVYNEQKNGYSTRRMMPPVSSIYYFLNHPDSDVVINPVDFSGGMFNTKLISDKFVATLKEIGKDCDAFVAQYKDYNYAKVSQKQAKEFAKVYKKKMKEIKKKSKSLPKKDRDAYIESEYNRLFLLNNYIKIIDDYKEKCTE